MKRGKQINWILSPKVYLNWFSIPTKKFGTYGRRLSIKLGYFHVMFTWNPGE
jgi:hypothetical protein